MFNRDGLEPDPDPDSPGPDGPRNDNGRAARLQPLPAPASAAPLWTPAFKSLLFAQLFFGFADALFVLLPKLLVVGYGADVGAIGIVMAAFGVASLVAIPAIAPAVRRLGRRRAMSLANLLLAASAAAFVFIPGAGVMATVLRGLHGIAWSLLFAAGTALVAELAPPARLGQAIGLYGGANLAMHALAPALAEPLAARYGARLIFVLATLSALYAAWRCRRLPEAAPPTATSGAAPFGAATVRSRAIPLLVLTVGGLAGAGMVTFIAPFALSRGVHVVRGFFVANTVTALAIRLGGARLTDAAGYRWAAFAGAAGYGAVAIAIGLVGPAHLAPLGALLGVAHGIVFPALMALIIGDVPAAARPRLLAFANGAINLGVTGVGVLGAIAARAGYPTVYVGTGALTIAASALLLLLRRAPASGAST
jgi:predicted MFS family arabinose efflux permease